MSDAPAIRLEGVSKKYRLFASPGRRLREALDPWRRSFHEDFWALHDISLEVPRGRTLGVLGLNGSGKSTLLQIIADVMEPTTGTVEVKGRVAALLELGAGFNRDLSGRENVITNSRILGLTHREALERLDAVQEFAEIGRFFDQPVKTYSSGMFTRLAFAMAICVDPDVLIIDEALSVGDTRFREKCYRRLKSLQEGGCTVLFVTHDRGSITQLCDDAILLHQGRLVAQGSPREVSGLYTELLTTGRLPDDAAAVSVPTPAPAQAAPDADAGGDPVAAFLADPSPEDRLARHPLYNANEARFGHGGAVVLDALLVLDGVANPAAIPSGAVLDIHLRLRFDAAMDPILGVSLHNEQGVLLYGVNNAYLRQELRPAVPGEVRCLSLRAPLPLAPGPVFIELAVASERHRVCDQRSRVLALEILRGGMFLGLADLGFTMQEATSPP